MTGTETTGETKGDTKEEEDGVDGLPCHAICIDLRKKQMSPAVIFQMDADKCREMFVKVVER